MATTETKTFKNFIGGEWVAALGGEGLDDGAPEAAPAAGDEGDAAGETAGRRGAHRCER